MAFQADTFAPDGFQVDAADALWSWVVTGSGLDAEHVIWTPESAGETGPVPTGTYIAMHLRDLRRVASDWVLTERFEDTFTHRVAGPRQQMLELTCFAGAAGGPLRASGVLDRLLTSIKLPSVAALLHAGNIGIGTRGPIRVVNGARSGMFDPRAIVEVELHLVAEMSESGAAIERLRVTNETTGEAFNVSKYHSWSNGFSNGFGG